MINGDAAKKIEERLADLLEIEVGDLRDYLQGRIGASGTRRTGYRLIRGTHGVQYVRDPEGTDILPAGISLPA
jgi:hypothetical protein